MNSDALTSSAGVLVDQRTVEDVTPAGQLFDGQIVCRFRLKGDPTPRFCLTRDGPCFPLRILASAILLPVARSDLEWAWVIAAPLLARCCSREGCDLTLSDLRGLVEREEALLVLVIAEGACTAAGVTQVREYGDGRRTAWVLTLGGAAAGSWRPIIKAIEAGARHAGCASLEFVGRKAWACLFPDFDADPEPVGFHFRKVLA